MRIRILTMKPARRRLRRLLTALALILLALPLAFQAVFYAYYHDFYATAQADFHIPGLAENFVPQGVEACGGGEFLLSGYVSTTGSARIYYISADGSARMIRVCDEEGTTLVSHSGGICTNGPFTYLAGGSGKCYVLSSADLFDPVSREANILGVFETGNAASFCCLAEDHLIVGEYEYGRFKTDAAHHITTPAGDANTAVLLAYPLDGSQPFGVTLTPDAACSVPQRIQGLCVTDDGRVVLSASSFRNSSQLLLYDREAVEQGPRGNYQTEKGGVPLYYLDSASCADVIPLPPYSEETVYVDGQLYVLFESAANRFRFGKLVGGQYIYRMQLPGKENGK